MTQLLHSDRSPGDPAPRQVGEMLRFFCPHYEVACADFGQLVLFTHGHYDLDIDLVSLLRKAG